MGLSQSLAKRTAKKWRKMAQKTSISELISTTGSINKKKSIYTYYILRREDQIYFQTPNQPEEIHILFNCGSQTAEHLF